MILKTLSKKVISILIVVSVLLTFTTTAFSANISYPGGISEKTAEESSKKTDILISNAVKTMQNKSLRTLVYTELFKDETLSKILLSVYTSLSENESTFLNLGIDISPANVSSGLSAYKSVAKSVAKSSSWSDVDLKKAKWGVETKLGFANALSAMLSPFNDVLYMLLCSGRYKASIININGSDGYKNGLMSMLEALGCSQITSNDEFKSQAAKDRGAMIENITMSVLSMLDELVEAPSGKLTRTLPDLAVYVENGGLEASVNALTKPLTLHIGDYIQLFTGTQMINVLMFIQDPKKYTMNFKDNITTMMNDMIKSSDIELAEIDLEKLASCKGSTGDAYIVIFSWLIDTLKLNKDKISDMLGQDEETKLPVSMSESLLAKSTNEILLLLIDLLTATQGKTLEYNWGKKKFQSVAVEYTENLGKEKFKRVLKGIDSTVNEFAVEFANASDLKSTLSKAIYSSNTLTTIAKALYGALESEEMAQLVSMIGIPTAPYSVAYYLEGGKFYNARQTLYNYSKWENINSVYWGFDDGDRNGFEEAVTALLSPFAPLFEALLANGTIRLFESVNIGGSNGYNTAVIPLLEALGCPSKSIVTYDEYVKGKGTNKIITNVLDPVFDLVDKVIERPVYNLTAMLPNLIFFVKNGSMMQCLDNILYPLTDMMSKLSVSLEKLAPELGNIKSMDLISKIEEAIPTITDEIKLEKPDLSSIAGMGEIVEKQSKRTYNGKSVKYDYVKADKTAVLITVLRYVIGIINNPDNGDLVGSMMSSGGDAGMFAQFSADIGDEMASMSTDETIEWLYKLFFRERPIKEETNDDSYSPTIIYVEQKDNSKTVKVVSVSAIILILAVVIIILSRNRIRKFVMIRKQQKLSKTKKDREGKQEA